MQLYIPRNIFYLISIQIAYNYHNKKQKHIFISCDTFAERDFFKIEIVVFVYGVVMTIAVDEKRVTPSDLSRGLLVYNVNRFCNPAFIQLYKPSKLMVAIKDNLNGIYKNQK